MASTLISPAYSGAKLKKRNNGGNASPCFPLTENVSDKYLPTQTLLDIMHYASKSSHTVMESALLTKFM
jgi:hypothetical protein